MQGRVSIDIGRKLWFSALGGRWVSRAGGQRLKSASEGAVRVITVRSCLIWSIQFRSTSQLYLNLPPLVSPRPVASTIHLRHSWQGYL